MQQEQRIDTPSGSGKSPNDPNAAVHINPIPVEIEVIEESDPPTDSPGEARKKFEDVEREYGSDVRAAETNLQLILKVIYTPDLNMTPWEHFSMKQSCLAGVGILSRIRHKKLTYVDIRDHLENLACLVDLTAQYAPRSSGYGAFLLANLASVLGKVGELLEDFSLKRVTDWNKISEHYVGIYQGMANTPKIPELTPKLSNFSDARLIAVGEFSTVYALKFGTVDVVAKVAYKKKRPLNRHRSTRNRKYILNSSQMGCIVKHPLFSRIYATFSTDEAYISLMEYQKGANLKQILALSRYLPTTISMVIVAQLCLAVEYLHYVGFIHRHLMPSNIVISPMCRVKVVDVSIGKVCSGIFSSRILNGFRRRTASEFSDHEIEGELAFQAPELVKKVAYGRAIDWWSLGVTAYELRFGRLPFRAASEAELKYVILNGELVFEVEKIDSQLNIYCAFIKALLRRNSKVRLCSRSYEQYRSHELFASLDWDSIETRDSIMEYSPVKKLLENGHIPTMKLHPEYIPDPTIITEFPQLKEATEQIPLYVFCTEKVHAALERQTPATEADTELVDEMLAPFDDTPYKFRDVYKATRL